MNCLPKIPRSAGFALVVILAFIVLLTVLVLAYFSYSSLQRQISSANSNQAAVDLFAQGAIATIVSDFKQEIAAGSTNYTFGTNTVSIPLAASNAAPVLVGSSTNLLNLLKRSANGLAFSPGAAARAAASSTTNASQNGRSISPARWNAPLLLPKADTNSTDLTPANFTAPDWILVTRGGANPIAWSTDLRWSSSATNTNAAIGRYAYAIYDEGGLLDANVAGYPPGTNSSPPSYKTTLASADLTQIGLSTNVISALVGWRNAASAQPAGSFPGYTFTTASQTNYLNAAAANTNGFLRTSNTNLVSGESDRMFVSRQQLIQFASSLADSGLQSKASLQNALQYLGTFSRALEQPSFAPNSSRPSIVGSFTPPSPSAVNTYQGNNTYYGGESAINMTGSGGFLSIRVQNAFTRVNGSQAVPGEPLVKTKFALSNLSRVATLATASQSQSDPIYARFGLSRSSATQPWTYNHGAANILKLSDVATRNREPDFAELLKAAINAGSVGKAGPSGQGNNDQYRQDVSGDMQILQIMANLIDQTKTDNYPTRIQFVDSTGTTRTVYGDQDLPYFDNWHFFSLTTRVPNPILNVKDTVPIGTSSGTNTFNHARVKDPAVSFDGGNAAYFIIPQVWNPHDANTRQASGGGPTTFRVVVETRDPAGIYNPWKINVRPTAANGHFDGAGSATFPEGDPPSAAVSQYIALDASNASLQFTDNSGGRAFREPTLLWRNGTPTGVSLSGQSRTEDASLTGKTYYGILIGETPVSWVNTVSGTNYIFQASNMSRGDALSPANASPNNITFRMQYQDSSGNWISYQEIFVEANLTDIPGHTLFVNKAEYTSSAIFRNTNAYANPLMTGVNSSGPQLTAPMGGPFDPRTVRFTSPITGQWRSDDPTLNGNPTLDALTLVANNDPTAAQNLDVANSNFVLMKTQRPSTSRGQSYEYTTPCRGYNATMHWYSSASWCGYANGFPHNGADTDFYGGLLSQNNPAVKILSRGTSGSGTVPQSIYYEDADGVARRAMGGYTPVSGSPTGMLSNTTSTVGLPMVTSGVSFSNGIVTPSVQSESRPIILHRPFRSVAEMSYAFRGSPWKNIDFCMPESGDTALLDVFCVSEPPSDGMVAGKVDLNTRQSPVLTAILAGAYRDELANLSSPPTGALPALSAAEAKNVADTLIGITTGTQSWRGPLSNVADLVGHFVSPNPSAVSGSDVYQYTSPANNTIYTFAGLSAALGSTTPSGGAIWADSASTAQDDVLYSQSIQRFRESAIRPLASCGQTRVWNVMIDLVTQVGRYGPNAASLDQFQVEGEQRYWVHLAIDRATGTVIDRQIELVSE